MSPNIWRSSSGMADAIAGIRRAVNFALEPARRSTPAKAGAGVNSGPGGERAGTYPQAAALYVPASRHGGKSPPVSQSTNQEPRRFDLPPGALHRATPGFGA